jgi:BlaI family transcriptional regulator, penicillinase repressor
MKAGSDIPEAELEVLGALWRLGSATVREVMEDLSAHRRRLAYTTILTLLSRLARRGYVRRRREGPADVYRPAIGRDEVAAAQVGSLVERIGGGEAAPLILKLVEAHRLSRDEVRRLRDLLDKLEAETEGDGPPARGGKR